MAKGLALPINMIVIVAVAVLVLVVISAFFVGGFRRTNIIDANDALFLKGGCREWIEIHDCSINKAGASGASGTDIGENVPIAGYEAEPGKAADVKSACEIIGKTPAICAKDCGCPP